MDSKTEKLNCLTLGEWKNDPISKKKVEYPFKHFFSLFMFLAGFTEEKSIHVFDLWSVGRELMCHPSK